MAKEYIERKAALLTITNDGCAASNVRALMSVPAADVVEVVHGEWKREQNRRTCSYCEFVYYDNGGLFNYCPNCGAKMDGKGDENQ